MSEKYLTPQARRRQQAAERRDPFAHVVEVHDQMRSLAPANAEHPARHMGPQAARTFLFDEAIIRAHKETT